MSFSQKSNKILSQTQETWVRTRAHACAPKILVFVHEKLPPGLDLGFFLKPLNTRNLAAHAGARVRNQVYELFTKKQNPAITQETWARTRAHACAPKILVSVHKKLPPGLDLGFFFKPSNTRNLAAHAYARVRSQVYVLSTKKQ